MIEKIYKNKYMATCDNCGTGQECDSWADVMEFMLEEGWKKKLFDGEWKHYCPECVEAEKRKRGREMTRFKCLACGGRKRGVCRRCLN